MDIQQRVLVQILQKYFEAASLYKADPIKLDVETKKFAVILVGMMNSSLHAGSLALLNGLKKGLNEWLNDNGKGIVESMINGSIILQKEQEHGTGNGS